jgi:TonB-dependent SusC/RagA subfamily outer membrane receptor
MKLRIILLLIISMGVGSTIHAQKPAKKITITGEVKDLNKFPVPGANILIDDVNSNILTTQNGTFKIKVKRTAQKISIVSPAGIAEEAINGRTTINFNLKGSVMNQVNNQGEQPGDEEINLGYSTVKKKNLTESVGKIDGTDKKYASYNSIYDMLKGEVAGVEVIGTSIKIRGASSFQMSTQPLFVVDDVIVNSIDNILPAMVKSIEILKGSSTAIYGSRGANGVILITTKK